jgi:hypothetical protein
MSMQSPTRAQQRPARIFDALFALTFVTSIAGLLLYDPVLNDADYILGAGADTPRRAAPESRGRGSGFGRTTRLWDGEGNRRVASGPPPSYEGTPG